MSARGGSSRRGGGSPGRSSQGGSSVGGGSSVRSSARSSGSRKRPAASRTTAQPGKPARLPQAKALADPEAMNDEVQRLLDEIRSVDVEWPLVTELEEPADTRVGRLQAEQARLTNSLEAMSDDWQEMLEEQEEIKALFAEVGPLNEEVAGLKTDMRELQAVVAEVPLAQETAEVRLFARLRSLSHFRSFFRFISLISAHFFCATAARGGAAAADGAARAGRA